LLTKVDEVVPEVRQNPFGIFPDLNKIRDDAARTLNIGPRDIFYNVNYTVEKERSFQIDRLNYSILQEAAERAMGYCSIASLSSTVSVAGKGMKAMTLE
jgi:hypothetical protein